MKILKYYIGLIAHPPGSIYATKNPNITTSSLQQIWGGEWVQLKDTFLVSSSGELDDFGHLTLGSKGGSKNSFLHSHKHWTSHTHESTAGGTGTSSTSHTHRVRADQVISNGSAYGVLASGTGVNTSSAGQHEHTSGAANVTEMTSAGEELNGNENMPPYIVVHFFERVAI